MYLTFLTRFFWLAGLLATLTGTVPPLRAAPTPPLERLITVDIRNQPIERALEQISRAGAFSFSYNPARVPLTTTVSVQLTRTPVREALNQVFKGGGVTYKMRGNHVILLRQEPSPDAPPKYLVLDGYILDAPTGVPIARASVFEKTTLASAISNAYGYYRIRLPVKLTVLRLEIRKQAYAGQTLTIRDRASRPLTVRLVPLPPPLVTAAPRPAPAGPAPQVPPARPDPVRSPPLPTPEPATAPPDEVLVASADSTLTPAAFLNRTRAVLNRLLASADQLIHEANLSRDTLSRTWQVSAAPYVGTNGRLSGRIRNRYSFNILAGQSLGVRTLEIGGLLNSVRGDVQGVQIAGLSNLVGGTVAGVQAAGLFNLNGRYVNGVQLAGLFNLNPDSARGVQLATLFNLTLGSISDGVQLAGLMNHTNRSINGTQVAGLFNFARREVRGGQVAGLFNYTRRITKGRQLGLINIADSAAKAPIGLFSHVRRGGFRRLEATTSEINWLNVTYRSGVRRLYNIAAVGTNFDRAGRPWLSAGYGLGTAFGGRSRTFFNLEGTYHHLFYSAGSPTGWNSQIRLGALAEIKLTPGLALVAGPTANWYFSTDGTAQPPRLLNAPLFTEQRIGTSRHWGWIGLQGGVRLGNRPQ